MDQIRLEDIIPQPAEFSVGSETFQLRPMSLADQVWCVETFGYEGFQKILDHMDGASLCRIAFRLMLADSASKLSKQDVDVFNEDTGEKTVTQVGGWRLLMCMVYGPSQLTELAKAVQKSFGASQAILDTVAKQEEDKKKASQLTGLQSLTQSPANTDGPSNISAVEPSERSRSSSGQSTQGRVNAS